MKRNLIIQLLLILAAFSAALAEQGTRFELSVYQNSPEQGNNVLLLRDTADVAKGVTSSGYLLAFSIEIDVREVDSLSTAFDLHLVTLGPNARNVSRAFNVEYGLPARIDSIEVKDGTNFNFSLRPLQAIDIDNTDCSYNHRVPKTFDFLPTAHTDIYFLPASLGNYYFDAVKELLETQYRAFKGLFNFTLPGKYSIYLCPCPLNTIIWDKRFWMMSDPTRSTGYAIYSPGLNSADPFLLIHTAVLSNLGYAPPFLSEGVAEYLSVSTFDMKQIVAENKQLPLRDMLDTYKYMTSDPWVADRTAASFVRYLINAYDLDRFTKLYKKTDDLSLASDLEEIYASSLETLEAEWLDYVDTTKVSLKSLLFQSYLSEMMFDYSAMIRYSQSAVNNAQSAPDSLQSLTALKRACFFNGEYYRAIETQQAMNKIVPSSSAGWMTLGSYQMMNGYYDEAAASIKKALELNPDDLMAKFNFGLNKYYRGDTVGAIELLEESAVGGYKEQSGAESKVMLGSILRATGIKKNIIPSQENLSQALAAFNQALSANNSSPSNQMWAGIASVELNKPTQALDYLNMAYFLETRPFYLGMINLWLGKANDLLGKRLEARDNYGRVLALPSADYHQKEAKALLEKAYKN